jgi:hypothetical protein
MISSEDIDKLRKSIKTNNSIHYNQKNYKKEKNRWPAPAGSELTLYNRSHVQDTYRYVCI